MKRTRGFVFVLIGLMIGQLAAADTQEERTAALSEALAAAAQGNRFRLRFDGREFSGPGWERLLAEGLKAQFFLIGEEHGIAENPKLAAQLFASLSESGYSKLAIEISPPMARIVDNTLRNGGLDGLHDLYARPGGEPAFFGMAEEAELLATVRAAAPGDRQVLWGVDYEVAGDRTLLRVLESKSKPDAARDSLDALVRASDEKWSQYEVTRNPEFISTFSGDPALVRELRTSWPAPDRESAWIMETLEETLEINRLWIEGRAWESNRRRASLLRSNFLRHWRVATAQGDSPRVMVKLGANHIVRGRNMTSTFDLGSLLPELADIQGGHSFSVMVVPGKDSSVAVLNPSSWSYESSPVEGGYSDNIEALTRAAYTDGFTLIDLIPIRPILGRRSRSANADLLRVVHGFDMLLVMSGSTASTAFRSD